MNYAIAAVGFFLAASQMLSERIYGIVLIAGLVLFIFGAMRVASDEIYGDAESE